MVEHTVKVLMVEDEETDKLLLKRQILKVAPKALFTIAETGEEFHEKVNWIAPDIIFSDYNLPDSNGVEMLLSAKKKWPQVPFIFVTGMLNNEEAVAKAVLSGASAYILKDNLDQVPGVFETVLTQSLAQKEAANKLRVRDLEKQMLLDKAISLLTNTEDFEQKAVLLETLQTIQDK